MLIKQIDRLAVRRFENIQRRDGLPDLAHWSLQNSGGRLMIDGVSAPELVEQYGSPLFVLNEKRLRTDIAALRDAFACAPEGSKILYSYKTNSVPGILRCVHRLGLGAEVISPYELWLANRLSVSPADICYNGVSKTRESLERAVDDQIFSINVDSLQELQLLIEVARSRGRIANLGVRLGVVPGTQFGIDLQSGDAMRAAELIAAHRSELDWKVVHLHAVANAQGAGDHLAFIRMALDFLLAARKRTGIEVPYLDIGGGFGVPTVRVMNRREYMLYRLFGIQPARPLARNAQSLASYFTQIMECIDTTCRRSGIAVPKLVIEPGRVVTSRAQLLLSRINEVKQRHGGPRFAMSDIGRHSVAYPCDYECHEILAANRLDDELAVPHHVVGRICTSADILAKNRLLPELRRGDVLAVLDAGAYFSSYSSNFAFPRPATVVVSEGIARLLHAEESFEHLVAMDCS